jgi:GH25 family lysozyme M1 (1,4-beta-N-acetylmuramidase)
MSASERPALALPGFLDGIDVSAVQSVSSYEAVANAGFRLATVKVSEGLAYCDPRRLEFLDGFRRAGLHTNVYGFARPSQGKPREQAQRLYACAGDVFPLRPVLDLESAPDDWSARRLVEFAEEFVSEVASWGVLDAVFYTYPGFAARMQPALAASSLLARCPLWIAQYRSTTAAWAPGSTDRPNVPAPWKAWTLWQYSGNGGYRVPGIVGDCDRNLFRGDEADLRSFFGYPPKP